MPSREVLGGVKSGVMKINFDKEANRIVGALKAVSGENDLTHIEPDLVHEWREYLEVIYSVGVLNGFEAVRLSSDEIEEHTKNRELLIKAYERESNG